MDISTIGFSGADIAVAAFFALTLAIILMGVRTVPQSENFLVERLGKYNRTLKAGLNFIIPILDKVSHRINILERQLPQSSHEVITRDNVNIVITTSIYFRVIDASRTVYRIEDINNAIEVAVTGSVRSIVGSIEFDEVQSHRENINSSIGLSLEKATADWGVEITRTEIIDVNVDDSTRLAMQQQLNSERERRALVRLAEGNKEAAQLKADAELYTAQKQAEAKRVLADADAYSTTVVSEAINKDGSAAIEFEILKKQIEALGSVASAESAKFILMPSDLTKVLDGINAFSYREKNG